MAVGAWMTRLAVPGRTLKTVRQAIALAEEVRVPPKAYVAQGTTRNRGQGAHGAG